MTSRALSIKIKHFHSDLGFLRRNQWTIDSYEERDFREFCVDFRFKWWVLFCSSVKDWLNYLHWTNILYEPIRVVFCVRFKKKIEMIITVSSNVVFVWRLFRMVLKMNVAVIWILCLCILYIVKWSFNNQKKEKIRGQNYKTKQKMCIQSDLVTSTQWLICKM